MSPPVIMDATPAVGGHGVRGIGTAVRGWITGFAQAPADARPSLLVAGDAPDGFDAVAIRTAPWPLRRANVPDPLPTAAARLALRGRAARVFHATQPQLVPPRGMAVIETCWDLTPLHFADYLLGPRHALERDAYRRYLARLRRAEAVIVTSKAVADDVVALAGVHPDRIRTVPLGVEAAPLFDMDAWPEHPHVLYSGSVEPHKNVEVLIRALPRVRDRDTRLILTGPWSRRRMDALRALAAAEGVQERVEFRGRVSRDELDLLRFTALAVAVPSRAEGFGLPVLEGFAAGVPVLTSTAPALVELTGWPGLDPDDPAAWAAAVDALGDAGDARSVASDEGPRRAAEYTWEASARAVAAIHREVAG